MNKKGIGSPRVPHPAGPYTPGIVIRDCIFVSGQRPQDPETGFLGLPPSNVWVGRYVVVPSARSISG